MQDQQNRQSFVGAQNQGNPRYNQQNLDALMAKSKKSNLAGYVVGGVSAGILAGAGAAILATDANAQDLNVDVNRMHEEMQAVEAQEVHESSAQPTYVVRETHVIHYDVPTPHPTPGPPPALPIHTPGNGVYAQMPNGSIVYMEESVIDDVPVMQVDVNLDGKYDCYVLPVFDEDGFPFVVDAPGRENVTFNEQGQPVMLAQPASGANVVDGLDTITGFMAENSMEESFDLPIVVDDGSDGSTLVVDNGNNGETGDDGGVLVDNGGDDPVEPDGGDANDENVAPDDGGEIVPYDNPDIPEPEPYVADVPSSDGMSDFVNDANVDMLA